MEQIGESERGERIASERTRTKARTGRRTRTMTGTGTDTRTNTVLNRVLRVLRVFGKKVKEKTREENRVITPTEYSSLLQLSRVVLPYSITVQKRGENGW